MDYPVLDNRPINQWKVMELKEELKRRNLTTKGLKDDLVRRLSEAISNDMEAVKVEESKGFHDTDPADGPEDTQPDPNPVKLVDDVKEYHPSEVTKGFDHDTDSACGPEDAQPDPNPVKLVDDVKEHHQSEVTKGYEPDTLSSGGLEDAPPDPNPATVVDDVQKHHQSGFSDINADVAGVSTKNCRVDLDHNKVLDEVATGHADGSAGKTNHLEAPVSVMSVADEVACGEILSTDQYVEEKIDEGHEAMNSSQDKDVVAGVSGVQDVSIQGSSNGQDVEDMKFSSSKGVLEDNFRRQENDVEVIPVASKEDLENDSVKLENAGLKLSGMDAESDMSDPTTQVYEVNPNLGSQVKSDSFSTDTLPINENKDLNDNLNADNVKLETEVVRQEKELQSSSKDLAHVGSSHPLDNQMPHEMQGLVGETDDKSSDVKFIKDFSKITDVVDGENMEEINLDQSSADDSMEEDVVETKHIDFDHISKEENDKTEEPTMREEPKVRTSGSSDRMQQDIFSEKVEPPQETKDRFPDLSEKRKFHDEVGGASKEPTKRPRRWNTESLKTAEPQNSSGALSKNLVQTNHVKPILGRTNSMVGADAPKERFVPKSSRTPTNSLKIENFLRPFTLKAAQELLARTGVVRIFWMDHIKTHCYVTYSSVEEAIETRNTVYNLQWPPKGGRLLVADFVEPEEVQSKIEGREPASPPKDNIPSVPPAPSSVQTPPARHQGRKQQVELEHPLTHQPAAPSVPPTKERMPSPVADKNERMPSPVADKNERMPSPVADKNDPPIVTLDDLFRKTKATPRIYYLPLTDEEVAKKLAIRGNTKN